MPIPYSLPSTRKQIDGGRGNATGSNAAVLTAPTNIDTSSAAFGSEVIFQGGPGTDAFSAKRLLSTLHSAGGGEITHNKKNKTGAPLSGSSSYHFASSLSGGTTTTADLVINNEGGRSLELATKLIIKSTLPAKDETDWLGKTVIVTQGKYKDMMFTVESKCPQTSAHKTNFKLSRVGNNQNQVRSVRLTPFSFKEVSISSPGSYQTFLYLLHFLVSKLCLYSTLYW